MAAPSFPYRRELRPTLPEALGEHVDREFQKIEQTIAAQEARIADLEARLLAASIP